MNRNGLNLVLLVVVGGLAAGAWFARQKKEAEAEKPPLTALAAEGISRILIQWPGSPDIALAKTAGQWNLTAPVQGRADALEVLSLTGLASLAVQKTVDGEGLDLKELGLDPPDHSITLNDQRVDFGITESIEYGRYLRLNDKVVLVEDTANAAHDKDYHDLVDKNLFAASDEIVHVELPGLMLARSSEGVWSAFPPTAAATPKAIEKLVADWKAAKSMWNEAAEATAPAGERLRFTLKDGRVQDYLVVGTDPQFALYAPALKIRYQLSKALADELLKLPEPLAQPAADPAATPAAAATAPPTAP